MNSRPNSHPNSRPYKSEKSEKKNYGKSKSDQYSKNKKPDFSPKFTKSTKPAKFNRPNRSTKSSKSPSSQQTQPSQTTLIYGINPVREALFRGYSGKKLYLLKSEEISVASESPDNTPKLSPEIDAMIAHCRSHHLPFRFAPRTELEELLKTHLSYPSNSNSKTNSNPAGKSIKDINHQGVVLELKESTRYVDDLEDFLIKQDKSSTGQSSPSIILVCDRITDPHNLGAISRSAYFYGCPLIITEISHSAPIEATVHKVSSGASLLLPYHRCEKLATALTTLKEHGYHLLSTGPKIEYENTKLGTSVITEKPNVDFRRHRKIALILGSEGEGVRPHLQRMTDSNITIDSPTHFDSLNVSVATGILLDRLSHQ